MQHAKLYIVQGRTWVLYPESTPDVYYTDLREAEKAKVYYEKLGFCRASGRCEIDTMVPKVGGHPCEYVNQMYPHLDYFIRPHQIKNTFAS